MSILERLTCETADLGQANVKKLLELFPECACEQGQVDFDKLRQVLSSHVLEGDVERYQFTWPGKRAAMAEANRKTNRTFRPDREASVNFDTTENLYIEGDNLEALKLLQPAYAGKVKMIYIDPPYNTGKDFVYRDRFSLTQKEIEDAAGAFDEEGNRYEKNDSSEARYHTNWCNMMYPRLKLARELLSDDGVIFISIDDNEVVQLRKLCDVVFGEGNFIAQLVWERAFAPKNDARFISNSHDYVVMYAKSLDNFQIGRLPRTAEANARYSNPDNDPRGVWMSSDISVKTYNAECDYPVTLPSGRVVEPPTGRCWSLSRKAFRERLEDNRIWFGPDGDGTPRIKRFLSELKFDGMAPTSLMFYKDVGHSQEGSQELGKLLNGGFFDGPKPTRLLTRLLTLAKTEKDSVILDFFSGSATTAHAVMQLNAEDGGKRKFILVQWPEVTDEKSEAYKAGYKNICEIGKERIRRAGKKIQEEHPLTTQQLDVGFRVLKIDSSSINDVSKPVNEMSQEEMNFESERIKADRSSEDLLFQVLLQTQIPLSEKIERETICGNEVFWVGGVMVACLDKQAKLTEALFTALAERQPAMAFFRDDTFVDDSARTNLEQIFKQFSKDTKIKVL